MLRQKYMDKRMDKVYSFQSVILASVFDVKNITLTIPSYHAPWNIAADFKVDMSFNPAEIASMLNGYESDHHTGMNIQAIAYEIYNYTSGYPFLVSKICWHIDETLDKNWTIDGVKNAVERILQEKNPFFDELIEVIENDGKLYKLLYDVLIEDQWRFFFHGNSTVDIAYTYGIIKRKNDKILISNKIFEIFLRDYFISKNETKQKI